MSASTSNLSNRSAPPAPSVMLYDLLDAGDEAAAAAPPAPSHRLSNANGAPRPVSHLMHAASSGRLSIASPSVSAYSQSRQSQAHLQQQLQQTQFVAPTGVAPRAARQQAAPARPRHAQAAAPSAAVGSGFGSGSVSSLQRSSSMRLVSRPQPPPNVQQFARAPRQPQVAQPLPQQTLYARAASTAAVAPAARAAAFAQMRPPVAPPQPQSLLMRPASALGNHFAAPAMAAPPAAPGGGKQMLVAHQRTSMASNGFVPQASLRSAGQTPTPPPTVDQYTRICLRQALL